MDKPVKIMSYWQTETGRFDSKLNEFINRKLSPIKEKELTIVLETSSYNNQPVIRFIGGPTGYESYYLADLEKTINKKPEKDFPVLYICAGTINSWPKCWVKWPELIEAIKQFKKGNSCPGQPSIFRAALIVETQ